MLKPAVQAHDIDGILVVEFWDCLRLDPAPVQQVRNHYEAHFRKTGHPDLVVDLSGVGYAGSAALGNFVSLHRVVRPNGGRIVFCNVDPTVAEVFRASKLESLFEFVSDRETACRVIKERPVAEPASRKPSESDGTGAAKPPGLGRSAIVRVRRRGDGSGSKKADGPAS
jgi:anti-anti-sigma factor